MKMNIYALLFLSLHSSEINNKHQTYLNHSVYFQFKKKKRFLVLSIKGKRNSLSLYVTYVSFRNEIMLPTRMIIYFIIILLIISYCCEAQHEFRNAAKAKANRKVNEANRKIQRGKEAVRNVKNQARAPFDRAGANINQKYENTRRKIEQIEQVIRS
jgi:hypothetical protein